MSNDLRTKLVLDLAGNLAGRAQQFQDAMQRMGTRSARSMALMKKSTEMAGRGLDAMSNRYTALASGAVGGVAVNNVVKMDRGLRSLQVASGKTAGEMKEVQRQLLATSQASHIRIDYSELEAGVAQVVEMTGDLDWALANRDTMGMTISATGASGDAVGAFMAELQKLGLTAEQTQEAITRMLSQGKEGAFTLQNLASLGPRVVAAYSSSGRQGTGMLQEMGAVLQMIRKTSGSSEQTATTFEALMRAFNDNKTVKALQKRGIKVFDEEALKRGEKILRPLPELMKDITMKTGGDQSKIGTIFTDAEAKRAFFSYANDWNGIGKGVKKGEFDMSDGFMRSSGNIQELINDSQVMADSYGALLNNLNTAWMEFSTRELSGPIESLATSLRALKAEDVQRWFEMGKAIAYVGAGAVVARKAWQAGMAVKSGVDWWRSAGQASGDGSGRGARGGLGGIGAPVPVYMVNPPRGLPSSRKNNTGQPSGGPAKPTQGNGNPWIPSRGQKFSMPTAKGAAPALLTAGYEVYQLAPKLLSDELQAGDKVKAASETAGGLAGMWAGAAGGAALGSFVPVFGTALGGFLGGALGYYLGGKGGELAADQINQSLDLTVTLKSAPGTEAEVTGMKSSSDKLNSQVYNGAGMSW
ncbi:hypothetical protein [Aeromonas veronii]|uniref:hypothetical protein n=1 Tax=Aeromonas veronii TaxID=654 RepID=UPI00330C81AD|nr:hypothetical protein [Aeromonas veronii]